MNAVWPLPPLEFPTYPSEGWLFDEDRALRDLMKGMIVSDHENHTRHVDAWFGHPDKELRAQDYPYVTIDLINIQEGLDRVHRGDYWTTDPPGWWGLRPLGAGEIGYLMEMPTPVDLDYQISTWARNPRHDRQILRQLIMGGRTMLRNGLLYTADKRIRRLDYMGHVKRDTVEEGGKRLFNNVIRVRISSEVPWGIWGGGYFTYTDAKRVSIGIRAFHDNYTVLLDSTSVEAAEIVAYNKPTADILIEEQQVNSVPVANYITVLRPGDQVLVSKDAKVPNPQDFADYRLVVIGVEHP